MIGGRKAYRILITIRYRVHTKGEKAAETLIKSSDRTYRRGVSKINVEVYLIDIISVFIFFTLFLTGSI